MGGRQSWAELASQMNKAIQNADKHALDTVCYTDNKFIENESLTGKCLPESDRVSKNNNRVLFIADSHSFIYVWTQNKHGFRLKNCVVPHTHSLFTPDKPVVFSAPWKWLSKGIVYFARAHTKQSIPRPNTFDPQSPVCLTSVNTSTVTQRGRDL